MWEASLLVYLPPRLPGSHVEKLKIEGDGKPADNGTPIDVCGLLHGFWGCPIRNDGAGLESS